MSRSIGTTGGYKGDRSFTGSVRESELPIVPIESQRQHNFERGKGQCLHRVSEGEKERRLLKSWKLLIFGNSGGNYTREPSRCL
jgi:hypothetical protein